MKRVFLDANVLWSAARKPAALPWRLIHSGLAHFLTSRYAVAEARRNTQAEDLPNLDRLVGTLTLVPDAFGPPPAGVCLPAKDVPILAAAALARADVLVTGDQHFAPFFGRKLEGMQVILPRHLADEIQPRR